MFTSRDLLVFLAVILIIIWRYFSSIFSFADGQKVRITTKVAVEPIRYEEYQALNLLGLKTYLPLFPEIHYGDVVVVEGEVDGEKLRRPKLVNVSVNQNFLYRVRKRIIDFYRKTLPEPDASLIAGVVLGAKSGMPENFWEDLKKTGTAHVVVASGMNVTMVASFLIAVLTMFIKRDIAIPFAIVGIWLYSFLSGFDAPIVRAAIMGSLAFGAQSLGRVSFALRSLFVSAALMLLIKPLWLIDLGFILSFVATASLMLFQSKIDQKLVKIPNVFREGLSTSLAAQIGVAPILFVTFGQFNILSPFFNALVLWTIPYMMILGVAGGLAGLFWPFLGKVILYFGYPFTFYFEKIVGL